MLELVLIMIVDVERASCLLPKEAEEWINVLIYLIQLDDWLLCAKSCGT